MSDVTTNAGEVAAELFTGSARAMAAVYGVVRVFGVKLQAQVKANAAGRPGPRIVTGDYNRSIGLTVGRSGTRFEARVGSARVQARRLEFGFSGSDSKGRSYNQPAYPHFGPALDKVGPEFGEAVAVVAAEALDGPGRSGS